MTQQDLFRTDSYTEVGRGVIIMQKASGVSAYFVGQDFPITDNALEIDYAACGMNHALVRCNSGSAYAVGSNLAGQCGLAKSVEFSSKFVKIASDVRLIACGATFSIMLFDDGRLCCSGSNKYGQLGLPACEFLHGWAEVQEVPNNITSISCGYTHSCLVSDGVVYAAGLDTHGQLRFMSNSTTAGVFTVVSFPLRVKHVACGVWTTAFLTEDGDVYIAGKAPMYQEGPRAISDFIKDYRLAEERASKATVLCNMTKLDTDRRISHIEMGSSTAIALCSDRVTVFIIDLVTLTISRSITHTAIIERISIGGNSWAYI